MYAAPLLPTFTPMQLASASEAFDDPDWIFEPKWDGFRALAYIDRGTCTLVSRRGYVYKAWPQLAEELTERVRCRDAVLDGEICCLAPDGRAEFYDLLFRRGRPHFMAFDLLWLDGQDRRDQTLYERKLALIRFSGRVH